MGRELRLTIASHDIERAFAMGPSITTCTTTTTSIMTTTMMRTSLSAMGTIRNDSQLTRVMIGGNRTAFKIRKRPARLGIQDSCSTTTRMVVTTTSTMTTMMMVNKLDQKRLQSTCSLRRSRLQDGTPGCSPSQLPAPPTTVAPAEPEATVLPPCPKKQIDPQQGS